MLLDPPDSSPEHAKQQEKRDASAMMMTGAGIGVLGAVAAAIGGAVCPLCVVAAPALLGVGAFRRWRASRADPHRAKERPLPTSGRP